jgi:hypothetical protein
VIRDGSHHATNDVYHPKVSAYDVGPTLSHCEINPTLSVAQHWLQRQTESGLVIQISADKSQLLKVLE